MSDKNSFQTALRAYVDAGALAGAATLVWRDGRVVDTAVAGCRDLGTNLPVERDTIFRIASMTKPLTSVAALMLCDEGRFALDEPIARHAPEFARLRVLRDPNGPLGQTDAAERPIARLATLPLIGLGDNWAQASPWRSPPVPVSVPTRSSN